MKQRDRLAAALLALFLGGIGAHWYYVGRSQWGTFYLLGTMFSLLLCGVLVGFVGLLFFGSLCLYDGITFLSMEPSAFESQYNNP